MCAFYQPAPLGGFAGNTILTRGQHFSLGNSLWRIQQVEDCKSIYNCKHSSEFHWVQLKWRFHIRQTYQHTWKPPQINTCCKRDRWICTIERSQSIWLLTIQLLDGQLVIQFQLEVLNVSHSPLVVGPHDGRIRGRMGQAQCVAKLVHCNCEQVCAAAVTWGGVKLLLDHINNHVFTVQRHWISRKTKNSVFLIHYCRSLCHYSFCIRHIHHVSSHHHFNQ